MPSRTHRGQGQWAHGHLEPLNAAERFKKDDDGLNVRQRILTQLRPPGLRLDRPARPARQVSAGGACTPSAARGFGGGKTGALEDAEIEDAFS